MEIRREGVAVSVCLEGMWCPCSGLHDFGYANFLTTKHHKMKKLLLLALILPCIAHAEKRGKYYKIAGSLNKSLKVAKVVDRETFLEFILSTRTQFFIKEGDTLTITLMDNNTVKLPCYRVSNYRPMHTGSGALYNGIYYKLDGYTEDVLIHQEVKSVAIERFVFESESPKAIQKALK